MNNNIPATGSLKHYSLPEIFTHLNTHKKTGVLMLENENVKKNIYIKDGDAVFASSNQEDERLGDILLKKGQITQEQYDKSVETLKQTGKRQGIIFVELGYLLPHDLFTEVRSQIAEIILSVFSWDNGIFSFKETPPPKEIITLNVSMENLIKDGVSRIEKKKEEEETSLVQKINELHGKIDELSYYDVFEVDIKAPLSEIRKSYLKKARDYHPDRHPNSAMKDKLATLFTFLNKAYNTLSDETKRRDYDNVLLQKTHKKEEEVSDAVRAEEQFNRGLNELKTGNYWGATDFLRWATRLNPQQAKYWAHLSIAFSNMPKRNKDAEEAVLEAIKLEPHNVNYQIHLGKIYEKAGMNKRAIHQFETVLNWDPTNKKALEELEKLKTEK